MFCISYLIHLHEICRFNINSIIKFNVLKSSDFVGHFIMTASFKTSHEVEAKKAERHPVGNKFLDFLLPYLSNQDLIFVQQRETMFLSNFPKRICTNNSIWHSPPFLFCMIWYLLWIFIGRVFCRLTSIKFPNYLIFGLFCLEYEILSWFGYI